MHEITEGCTAAHATYCGTASCADLISGWQSHGIPLATDFQHPSGESVEVEGSQGGRGWEYLLGMPLWSEALNGKSQQLNFFELLPLPQCRGLLQRNE